MLKKLKITDYIIITLVLFIIILGSLLVFKKKHFSNLPIEKEVPVAFDVQFRGISVTSSEMPFKKDSDAFITIRNVPYTKLKITNVKGDRRKIHVNAYNDKGYDIVVDETMPNLYDFVVTLKDNAKKTPDGYVIGGNKLKMGIPIVIEGDLYRYQGSVSNVYEVK